MKEYLIVGWTMRETMYCFDYMRWLLQDKIVRVNRIQRIIIFEDIILRFASDELYWRDGSRGNRAEVIGSRYVEKQLDRYKVLARI